MQPPCICSCCKFSFQFYVKYMNVWKRCFLHKGLQSFEGFETPQALNSSLKIHEPQLREQSQFNHISSCAFKTTSLLCSPFPCRLTDMVKCPVHAWVKACGLQSKISIHGRDHLTCSERFARSRGEPRAGFKNDRYEEAKRNKEIKYSNPDLFQWNAAERKREEVKIDEFREKVRNRLL